jgi:uncharacterized protein YndB with AHSA1/START domain
MKQSFEIEIDAAIEDVWAAFTDADNMGRWIANFESFTPISGEPGQPGSVAELVFDEKGKRVVLKETITERRDPDFLAASYEADHGTTLIVNHFQSVDGARTRWTSWNRFAFSGIMRFFAIFLGGVIRKRTEADLERFKLMVESDLAGKDA